MDVETVKSYGTKMREMSKKCGSAYYELLGYKIVMIGKDVQTAVNECYQELILNNKE